MKDIVEVKKTSVGTRKVEGMSYSTTVLTVYMDHVNMDAVAAVNNDVFTTFSHPNLNDPISFNAEVMKAAVTRRKDSETKEYKPVLTLTLELPRYDSRLGALVGKELNIEME